MDGQYRNVSLLLPFHLRLLTLLLFMFLSMLYRLRATVGVNSNSSMYLFFIKPAKIYCYANPTLSEASSTEFENLLVKFCIFFREGAKYNARKNQALMRFE